MIYVVQRKEPGELVTRKRGERSARTRTWPSLQSFFCCFVVAGTKLDDMTSSEVVGAVQISIV